MLLTRRRTTCTNSSPLWSKMRWYCKVACYPKDGHLMLWSACSALLLISKLVCLKEVLLWLQCCLPRSFLLLVR